MIRTLMLVVTGSSMMLSACTSRGPGRMSPDRFNYNQAIAQSSNEQMLLNLVRLRYSEIPVFLAVSSVLTQYSYASSVGAHGFGGSTLGEPWWQVGGSANFQYVERPTITYAPLAGDEFADQLLKPIPIDMVFSLVDSGWSPEQLLFMTLFRVNDVLNVPFEESRPGDMTRLRAFRNVVEQMNVLGRHEAIEVQREENNGRVERYLVFDEDPDPEAAALIRAFKKAVGLGADRSRFRVTTRIMGRKPDEITVRVRSLLELMGFLSQGIKIPAPHVEEGRAVAWARGVEAEARELMPMFVRSQAEPPETAPFVAVQYQGHWYYIPHSDLKSKQAFSMLAYLFQMQAPHPSTAGPLLTVPTG